MLFIGAFGARGQDFKLPEPSSVICLTPGNPGLSGIQSRPVFSHWQLNLNKDNSLAFLAEPTTVSTPPIPLGFFCKFEDNIWKKFGFGLDIGTEVRD